MVLEPKKGISFESGNRRDEFDGERYKIGFNLLFWLKFLRKGDKIDCKCALRFGLKS